ncbi:PhoD-like phosphatase N-terminal domain-containing protein [Terrabacter sp. AAH1]
MTMIERRSFLAGSAAAAGSVALAVGAAPSSGASTPGSAATFRHGVASGDPLPGAVVIWTRVTLPPRRRRDRAPARARPSAGRSPPTRAFARSCAREP